MKTAKKEKPPGHQKLHFKIKISILCLYASIPLRPCYREKERFLRIQNPRST
ncbi:hypothetical protein AAJ76_271000291 [Vairimorpha ceranae]|uniref:Uncharacterized protein n=1 Tax=Vairimorpha ceranae TaxID=40302 RepID=A0A0F9YLU6_9MICR|nr:hypothetical protein AAJ76_271000291 [Vairimorpha ceranae]KKO73732.1 hypothetical protein AAJ76_271000291 [Vairimorpha ceranae]